MNIKNVLSYVFCVLTLAVLFIYIDYNELMVLSTMSISSILVSIFMAFVIYALSGIEYYYIRRQFGVSLKTEDIFLLPIVGNLWSFIFPFQGNLLFTTLFFKHKYNMAVSESFSISIYLYLVTLCFTGIFALLFAIINNMLFSWLSVISVVLIFNPLLVFFANLGFGRIGNIDNKLITRIQKFLCSTIANTNVLWTNYKLSLAVLALTTLRILLSFIWFYWISISLGYNLSFISVGLISLIMSVSLVIKFTPDNLGVAQLITASVMGLIGGNPERAALISLVASAISMVLIFTVGIYGNWYYFKSIDFVSLISRAGNNEPD